MGALVGRTVGWLVLGTLVATLVGRVVGCCVVGALVGALVGKALGCLGTKMDSPLHLLFGKRPRHLPLQQCLLLQHLCPFCLNGQTGRGAAVVGPLVGVFVGRTVG